MTNTTPEAVFYKYVDTNGVEGYHFWCPGCDIYHGIKVGPNGWTFNGDVVKPTVSPSLLVSDGQGVVCHSFIKDGNIQFLSDCRHELRGQTVPIPADTDGR